MTKVHSLKFIVYSIILLVLSFAFTGICFAQPISSSDLINNAKFYDGKNVSYVGEVIGDIMMRGNFAWVNVNDGKNALGIWIDKALLKEITYTGNYRSEGDRVEVTGVFHRACLAHGGDLDIHAQIIRKIVSGRSRRETLSISKRNLTFLLSGILLLMLALSRVKSLRAKT